MQGVKMRYIIQVPGLEKQIFVTKERGKIDFSNDYLDATLFSYSHAVKIAIGIRGAKIECEKRDLEENETFGERGEM